MTNQDLHPECKHCLDIPTPVWPMGDREAWLMDCCHAQAITEETEQRLTLSNQQKMARAAKQAQAKKDNENRLRDRKAKILSTINMRRSGLLNINYGGNNHMAKKTETGEVAVKAVKKTGLIDQLIRNAPEKGYGEGEKEAIVSAVKEQFPAEDEKRLSGLFFSRRSQIKKALETQSVA